MRGGVGRITVVHGTFVGDDPLALVDFMRRALPRFPRLLERALRGATRRGTGAVLGDLGHFTPEYLALLAVATDRRVVVEAHGWSSGNAHVPRLLGATALVRRLAATPPGITGDATPKRELLFGHSHAGQLFAIVTQLVAGTADAPVLLDVAEAAGDDRKATEAALSALVGRRLVLVTLGTPPRYGFASHKDVVVLHFVNHRGASHLAGTLAGVLHTWDGDYVQQWGIAGSDLLAHNGSDRALNARLNDILDAGADLAAWRKNILQRMRLHRHGVSWLVDYGDGGGLTPNWFTTFFGHGVYTRYEALLFHLEQVARFLTEEPRTPSHEMNRWTQIKNFVRRTLNRPDRSRAD